MEVFLPLRLKNQNNDDKVQKLKKMLKLAMLKSWQPFHFIYKLYSNLLSDLRGGSLALEAGET